MKGEDEALMSPHVKKYLEIIRFYASHEAYLLNHVCHQYNFVVDVV